MLCNLGYSHHHLGVRGIFHGSRHLLAIDRKLIYLFVYCGFLVVFFTLDFRHKRNRTGMNNLNEILKTFDFMMLLSFSLEHHVCLEHKLVVPMLYEIRIKCSTITLMV